MLKVPRRFLFQGKTPQLNNKKENLTAQMGALSDEISLTTIEDIKWVTNVIEPEQQRGPSENA